MSRLHEIWEFEKAGLIAGFVAGVIVGALGLAAVVTASGITVLP